MRETEYAYAVAKIRANEVGLLSASGLDAVITAPDYSAALKSLTDMGYADFSESDPDDILKSKEREAFDLICEVAPDKDLFDFLVVKNDFHNIKAVLKALVMNTDYSPYLLKPCLLDSELIYKAATERDAKILPDWAGSPVLKGYDLAVSTMDGQLLDVYLDKCYLETSLNMAKQSREDFSVGLAERTVLVADLQIAMRGSEMGKSPKFLKEAMAHCGFIETDKLVNKALEGKSELADYIAEKGFEALADGVRISDKAFERAADDMLMDYVKGARYLSFGIAPLIGYYLARISEVKDLRIILCCKRTDMSKKEIRERVRKLYV